MKTLLLMRHAKSSWKDTDLPDHERPLNKRGRRDAPMMGELLAERELIPERILSSSALRARQTAELMAETAGYTGNITYLDRLFMAEVDEYINALNDLPDDVDPAMLIGHNPGMETLLQMLSGQIEALPTAVIAHLRLPIESWAELTLNTQGELVEIWRPKELREEQGEKEEKGKEKPHASERKGKEKGKGKGQEKKKKK
jgi:phosphohistidine phosphatase